MEYAADVKQLISLIESAELPYEVDESGAVSIICDPTQLEGSVGGIVGSLTTDVSSTDLLSQHFDTQVNKDDSTQQDSSLVTPSSSKEPQGTERGFEGKEYTEGECEQETVELPAGQYFLQTTDGQIIQVSGLMGQDLESETVNEIEKGDKEERDDVQQLLVMGGSDGRELFFISTREGEEEERLSIPPIKQEIVNAPQPPPPPSTTGPEQITIHPISSDPLGEDMGVITTFNIDDANTQQEQEQQEGYRGSRIVIKSQKSPLQDSLRSKTNINSGVGEGMVVKTERGDMVAYNLSSLPQFTQSKKGANTMLHNIASVFGSVVKVLQPVEKVEEKPKKAYKTPSIFPCDDCGATLHSQRSLETHRKTHHTEWIEECLVCAQKFQSPQRIRAHIIDVHGGEDVYACFRCDFTSQDLNEFWKHRKHHQTSQVCHCGKKYLTAKYYKEHMASCTRKGRGVKRKKEKWEREGRIKKRREEEEEESEESQRITRTDNEESNKRDKYRKREDIESWEVNDSEFQIQSKYYHRQIFKKVVQSDAGRRSRVRDRTHRCYLCFKLFPTPSALLQHKEIYHQASSEHPVRVKTDIGLEETEESIEREGKLQQSHRSELTTCRDDLTTCALLDVDIKDEPIDLAEDFESVTFLISENHTRVVKPLCAACQTHTPTDYRKTSTWFNKIPDSLHSEALRKFKQFLPCVLSESIAEPWILCKPCASLIDKISEMEDKLVSMKRDLMVRVKGEGREDGEEDWSSQENINKDGEGVLRSQEIITQENQEILSLENQYEEKNRVGLEGKNSIREINAESNEENVGKNILEINGEKISTESNEEKNIMESNGGKINLDSNMEKNIIESTGEKNIMETNGDKINIESTVENNMEINRKDTIEINTRNIVGERNLNDIEKYIKKNCEIMEISTPRKRRGRPRKKVPQPEKLTPVLPGMEDLCVSEITEYLNEGNRSTGDCEFVKGEVLKSPKFERGSWFENFEGESPDKGKNLYGISEKGQNQSSLSEKSCYNQSSVLERSQNQSSRSEGSRNQSTLNTMNQIQSSISEISQNQSSLSVKFSNQSKEQFMEERGGKRKGERDGWERDRDRWREDTQINRLKHSETQNNIENPSETQNNIENPSETQNNIQDYVVNPSNTQNNILNPSETQNSIQNYVVNPSNTQNNILNLSETQNNIVNPSETQTDISSHTLSYSERFQVPFSNETSFKNETTGILQNETRRLNRNGSQNETSVEKTCQYSNSLEENETSREKTCHYSNSLEENESTFENEEEEDEYLRGRCYEGMKVNDRILKVKKKACERLKVDDKTSEIRVNVIEGRKMNDRIMKVEKEANERIKVDDKEIIANVMGENNNETERKRKLDPETTKTDQIIRVTKPKTDKIDQIITKIKTEQNKDEVIRWEEDSERGDQSNNLISESATRDNISYPHELVQPQTRLLGRNKKHSVRREEKDKMCYCVESEKVKPWKCRECNKGYSTQRGACDHYATSHGGLSHTCQQCPASYVRKRDLIGHYNKVHLNIRPYKCKISSCPETFSSHGDLYRHLGAAHPSKATTFSCDLCDATFAQKRYRDAHTDVCMSQVTDEYPFRCPVCQKGFKLLRYMNNHMRTVHLWKDEQYFCELCKKVLTDKRNLVIHMKSHLGETQTTCKVCGKHFARKSYLWTHMRTHTNERPYCCTQCPKSFKQYSTWKTHERTHTGEKPYQCPICLANFRAISSMNKHIQYAHYKIRDYVCDICKKAFISRTKLDEHMIVHSGDKPYKCDVCERAFNKKHNLRIHMYVHSPNKKFKCELCGEGFMRRSAVESHILEIHNIPPNIIINNNKTQDNSVQTQFISLGAKEEEEEEVEENEEEIGDEDTYIVVYPEEASGDLQVTVLDEDASSIQVDIGLSGLNSEPQPTVDEDAIASNVLSEIVLDGDQSATHESFTTLISATDNDGMRIGDGRIRIGDPGLRIGQVMEVDETGELRLVTGTTL